MSNRGNAMLVDQRNHTYFWNRKYESTGNFFVEYKQTADQFSTISFYFSLVISSQILIMCDYCKGFGV